MVIGVLAPSLWGMYACKVCGFFWKINAPNSSCYAKSTWKRAPAMRYSSRVLCEEAPYAAADSCPRNPRRDDRILTQTASKQIAAKTTHKNDFAFIKRACLTCFAFVRARCPAYACHQVLEVRSRQCAFLETCPAITPSRTIGGSTIKAHPGTDGHIQVRSAGAISDCHGDSLGFERP